MKLKHLIKVLGDCRIEGRVEDFDVCGISSDSKTVQEGFIFVAVKGVRQDGRIFIEEAIRRGARVIVSRDIAEKIKPAPGIVFITVADDRLALARLANEFYGHPSRQVKTVGITGTNGKTTVSYLLESLLEGCGFSAGIIGTVNYRFRGKVIESRNTTPGPLELQSILAMMQKEGISFALIEVSSHALDQERVEGVDFHSAIFTNLTQDHLDYHQNLENYFQAKSRLFQELKPHAFAVINNDDRYAARLKGLTAARVVTYAIDNAADITATDIKLYLSHSEFTLNAAGRKLNISIPLIGRHNVYNALAALSWGIAAGLDLSGMEKALAKFSLVPGRLEKIENNKDLNIFVDYAHTEDALRNVITSLRQITPARIIVVFGCGGERDKTKRPKMGETVTALADYAVITSDNPRSEDPGAIVEDIKRGISKDNYEVVLDRRSAIAKALSLARAKDAVLIAGKGHESYQIFKNSVVYFDDREVTRECLR